MVKVNYRVELNGHFIGIYNGKRDFYKRNPGKKGMEGLSFIKIKESKKTEYVIYSNDDVYSDENLQAAKENLVENAFWNTDDGDCIKRVDNFGKEVSLTREEYEASLSEERIMEECQWMNETWFDDEISEMKHADTGREIIALADLGLWNGRRTGYKILQSLKDVMYSDCDYEKVYVDARGDLRKEESHHDGSNSILYRYWKPGLSENQQDNFLAKCYRGELKAADVTRYTERAGKEIADLFGWKIR